MIKTLDILVQADRSSEGLWPISQTTTAPMLPLLGKPLIDHALEAIALHLPVQTQAHVLVRLSMGDEETAAHLARSGWPGLKIEITHAAARLAPYPMIAMRGDRLTMPAAISEAMAGFAAHGGSQASTLNVGLASQDIRVCELGDSLETYSADPHSDMGLADLAAYHRIAIAAARGSLAGLNAAGWEEADGLRLCLGAEVLTRRAPGKGVIVGANAYVDKLVSLGDGAQIGAGCYIARGAWIENTIVMPYTFVGNGQVFRNCIIAGPWVCQMDTGIVTRVDNLRQVGRLAA